MTWQEQRLPRDHAPGMDMLEALVRRELAGWVYEFTP